MIVTGHRRPTAVATATEYTDKQCVAESFGSEEIMRIAYFECFAGASGDMILGALVDAGLDLDLLKQELAKLKLSHYEISAGKTVKHGIAGISLKITVDNEHHHNHPRHLRDIEAIITDSSLQPAVISAGLAIFRRLAEAEAKVHNIGPDQVHFHEVGAVDAILDIIGAVAGLALLGIERIYCSPLHVGSGTVQCRHGVLPVPAPATAELIKGKPIYSNGTRGELLTPTGAAILTTLSVDFGAMPTMTLEKIGYGAGQYDLSIPNLLRVAVGTAPGLSDAAVETVAVIETAIDDMNPQIYDYLMDRLLAAGALDVVLKPVQMKKNRPAVLLTGVCRVDHVNRLADLILRETTTLGLRWRLENRLKVARRIVPVATPYGVVPCKVATIDGEISNVMPEYEVCKQAALRYGTPLKTVMELARSRCLADLEQPISSLSV